VSLYHLLHAALVTLRISLPTVWDAARGQLTTEVCDARLDFWSRKLVERADMQISVFGAEHALAGRSYVVMSNHQSHYDIPVLYRALPLSMRMVAKRELFRIPLWSSAMHKAGFVELDRSNRERAIESLNRSRDVLAAGTSIWIAPEGTRSMSGELGPFKKGGFKLAAGIGAPILPVTIVGTREALPSRGRKVMNGARVRVTVHPAVETSGFSAEAVDPLVDRVRSAIASALG